MKLQHETRMYPPRVKMTVTLRNPDQILKIPVKFEGCSSDSQLNTDITFPLGNEFPLPSTSPIGSQPEYFSNTIVAHSKCIVLSIIITIYYSCPNLCVR